MKTTIFARILLATLLPLAVVLTLVIATINTIIYRSGTNFAKEAAVGAAKQYSLSLSEKVSATDRMMLIASRSLANPDFESSKAKFRPQATIASIMRADPMIYSAWFAFEPGLYPDGRRYYQMLVRDGDYFVEVPGFNETTLTDPEKNPWYE